MITQKELKELLHYNPETGVFTWLQKAASNTKIGSVAGCNHNCGYITIRVRGKLYLAHRLAWLYVAGEWPKKDVDHSDHIRNNNKWDNLLDTVHRVNAKNQSKFKNNKSGVTGVHWNKNAKKWQSKITVNYKCIHIGYFTDKFESICARKSAENKYNFHINHGR